MAAKTFMEWWDKEHRATNTIENYRDCWRAAQLAVESSASTNTGSTPLLCHCGNEIAPSTLCEECEHIERIAG